MTNSKVVHHMSHQGFLFSNDGARNSDATANPESAPEAINISPGNMTLYREVLPSSESKALQNKLLTQLPWQQPSIRMHGKLIPIPRLQVWMGDQNTDYRYSGKLFTPEPWHPEITAVKQCVEALSGAVYNSVLCNLYRTGQDSVSWHADDEPELCKETPIASFSLGALRRFDLRLKADPQSEKIHVPLEHNTLLIMSPEIQNHWQHQHPKPKKESEPRINLTFRKVRA